MKRKYLFLAIAALLVAGALWFGRSAWRTSASDPSSMGVKVQMPRDRDDQAGPKVNHTLRPPDHNRRFRELTPEQRVDLARKGPIGG